MFKPTVKNYGDSLITDPIEHNLASWLNWSLLSIGAFDNIQRNTNTGFGDRSKLKPVNDIRFPANSRWQSHRTDWVWESGLNYHTQPINVTGVWVNNNFYPTATTTGLYQHYINYPNGQVVFNTGIPSTSVVQAAHSQKYVQVHRSDVPWFSQIINRSMRVNDVQFDVPSSSGAGGWNILAENRIQLPSIIIEPTLSFNIKPAEIGNMAGIYKEDFLLHVLAETPQDRKRLTDILVKQFDYRIQTYDIDNVPYPLDIYGRPTPSALTYPQLIEDYPWQPIRISNISSNVQPDLGKYLYWSTVRYTLALDLA